MLDKAILHKKEHRKQYTGCKAIDKSCRNHGDCPWCQGNRHYSSLRRLEKTQFDLRMFMLQAEG